jgi:hypothetical protein
MKTALMEINDEHPSAHDLFLIFISSSSLPPHFEKAVI